jgi:YbbR domain-containing protein
VSWKLLTDDWRLKLLALGLAILMLGAVAFSQNPPTSKPLTVGLNYPATQNQIVVINPPSKITVTITGLADIIATVTPDNLTATVDTSHAKAGNAQKLNVTVTPTDKRVGVQQPAPIVVDVDTITTREVQVEVKATSAPGWSVSNALATCPGSSKPNPCSVHFTGPSAWMNNLHAYVTFPGQVSANNINSPNQPVQLQNSSGYLDVQSCSKITTPACSLDEISVSVHIDAVAGSTSSTVALLDAPPSHPPANGYRVTAITITPNTATISGDPVVLAKIRNIMLPPVDLTGRTTDATFTVTIQYPDGTSGTVATASVKYSISPNPNASPSPGA